jgi:hypothetical protein
MDANHHHYNYRQVLAFNICTEIPVVECVRVLENGGRRKNQK